MKIARTKKKWHFISHFAIFRGKDETTLQAIEHAPLSSECISVGFCNKMNEDIVYPDVFPFRTVKHASPSKTYCLLYKAHPHISLLNERAPQLCRWKLQNERERTRKISMAVWWKMQATYASVCPHISAHHLTMLANFRFDFHFYFSNFFFCALPALLLIASL